MKKKVKIEAFSKEKKRAKINGEWYDVAENALDFLQKGPANVRIEDGTVMFIEPLSEPSQPLIIVYENLLRTAAQIASGEKTTKARLKKTLEVTDELFDYLKKKGVLGDESE